MKKILVPMLCLLLLAGLFCGCDSNAAVREPTLSGTVPTLRTQETTADADNTEEIPAETLNGQYMLAVDESIVKNNARKQPTGIIENCELRVTQELKLSFSLEVPLEFSITAVGTDSIAIELLGEAMIAVMPGEKLENLPADRTRFTLTYGQSVTVMLEQEDMVGYYTFTIVENPSQ